MDKNAELFVRVEQEMLDAIDAEAKKIGENRSIVARMMLREALTARGYFEVLDGARETIARRSKSRGTAK